MKTITLYNDVGEVMGIATSSDSNAFADGVGEFKFIEENISNDHYIQNGQAIYKGQDPSTTEVKYSFDYVTKNWSIDLEQTAEYHRRIRTKLLEPIDQINPVWYASLTADQQQDLATYRQQLLDVPQQSGFPNTVEWPAKPTWL